MIAMRRIEARFEPREERAVGVVALRTDVVMERELRAWLPSSARLLHTRIPNAAHVTGDTLRAMERELPGAVRLLPPDVGYAVVAYGCTSASVLIGEARVAELVRSVIGEVPVTNPLTAIRARLDDLGARRIALLTPYTEDVSRALVERLEGTGIEVVRAATFAESDDARVARLSRDAVLGALVELGRAGGCDAVVGSCTNLPALGLLEDAERAAGVPVITSNSALAWHVGRHLGARSTASSPGSARRRRQG